MRNYFAHRLERRAEQADISRALAIQGQQSRRLVEEIQESAGHLTSTANPIWQGFHDFQIAANRAKRGKLQ